MQRGATEAAEDSSAFRVPTVNGYTTQLVAHFLGHPGRTVRSHVSYPRADTCVHSAQRTATGGLSSRWLGCGSQILELSHYWLNWSRDTSAVGENPHPRLRTLR